MQDSTTKTAGGEGLPTFGPDTIDTQMRARVRTTIEAIVQEELDGALGAEKSARVGETRQGYRHGSRERTLTTSLGGHPKANSRHRKTGHFVMAVDRDVDPDVEPVLQRWHGERLGHASTAASRRAGPPGLAAAAH